MLIKGAIALLVIIFLGFMIKRILATLVVGILMLALALHFFGVSFSDVGTYISMGKEYSDSFSYDRETRTFSVDNENIKLEYQKEGGKLFGELGVDDEKMVNNLVNVLNLYSVIGNEVDFKGDLESVMEGNIDLGSIGKGLGNVFASGENYDKLMHEIKSSKGGLELGGILLKVEGDKLRFSN